MRQKNKGITLIALVITIIVLLILAGVAIATLTGDNGILTKAVTAKKNTEDTSAKERIQMEVMGSYGEDGTLDVDTLKSNISAHIPEATVEGDAFPITVTLDGKTFTIDAEGNVELAGTKIVVDESSVTMTLEDGSAIPEDGADKGTKLKINFTASIEGGTITISPNVPYVTNGTEMEVTFTITGTVDGKTYTTTKNVELKDFYKKTEFGAEDIAKKPATFYGSIVNNYSVNITASDNVKNAVTTWRIFYAGKELNGTEDNIYLIADDYIPYTAAPDGKSGSKIYKNSDYKLSFDNVYEDYEGSSWILGNSLAKGWLSKYFNYTPDNGVTYPNRTSENMNIKAVAYMLDTNVWSSYAGGGAKYAIGTPPLEMFIESYKETHTSDNVGCEVNNTIGYTYSESSSTDYNGIYRKKEISKAYGMWFASPSATGEQSIANNALAIMSDKDGPGLRPVVCLNSEVQLEQKSEGVYSIK